MTGLAGQRARFIPTGPTAQDVGIEELRAPTARFTGPGCLAWCWQGHLGRAFSPRGDCDRKPGPLAQAGI